MTFLYLVQHDVEGEPKRNDEKCIPEQEEKECCHDLNINPRLEIKSLIIHVVYELTL